MTVEYKSSDVEEPQVPRWVGVMIAVVLVGSMAGGGALWAWSYYSRPSEKDLAEVRASPSMISVAPRPPQTNVILPISTGANKSYQIRGTDIVVSVAKLPNDSDFTFRFLYSKADLIPADQVVALSAHGRLIQDPAYAKFLKVTDDQLKLLKEVSAERITTILVVAPADLAKMKSLFAAYIATPKSDTEQAVVKAAQQIGQASLAPTRAAIGPKAAKIAQILTAEQLAAFKVQ
jgi:hypothetical protein